MTPRIVNILTNMRRDLEQDAVELGFDTAPVQEEASGPGVPGVIPGSPQDNGPDVSAVSNPGTAQQNLDAWFGDLADTLVQNYGLADEEAFGMIFDSLDALAETESIRSYPGDGASDEEAGNWLGYAKTLGLDAMVLDIIADSMMEESTQQPSQR